MFQVFVNHNAMIMGKVRIIPIMVLAVEKKGLTSGSPEKTTTFQSKVGRGLSPRPLTEPVTAARMMLSGAIQVIQFCERKLSQGKSEQNE